jgi:methylenetetrahydrofolate reductase (NADPH)
MGLRAFEIVCEIEPPVRPDLTHARHQIGVLTAVSSTFLIPDNHIGRATVSSIAVAHEVQAMGGRSIAYPIWTNAAPAGFFPVAAKNRMF